MHKLLIPVGLLIFLSLPIAFAIGLGVYIYAWFMGEPSISLLIQRMIGGVNSFPMLSLPLFILMGELMERGGGMKRLMILPNVLFRRLSGGMGIVNIGTSVLFGGISGSSVADVAAVGTIMKPEMKRSGFIPGFSAALQGVSGSLASIIPPSIVLILIGVAGGVSIGDLFLAGIIPGILIGVSFMVYVYIYAKIYNIKPAVSEQQDTLKDAIKKSLLPLGMPVIILGGILAGIFTATESAAVSVLYAFILGQFIYRELTWKKIKVSLYNSIISSATVMILIATSNAFAWLLTKAQATEKFADFLLSVSENPMVILFMMMIVLLFLGMILEAVPIILITTPIFMPIAINIGMNPVHFGILMAVNLAIGSNTPPMAVTLITACRVFKIKIEETFPHIVYLMLVMIIVLVVLVVFPELSLFIPNMSN